MERAGARAAVSAEETGQGTQVLPVGGKGKEAYTGFAAGGPARAGSSSGGDAEGAGREPLGALPAGAEREAGNDLAEWGGRVGAGDGLPVDLCGRATEREDAGGFGGEAAVEQSARGTVEIRDQDQRSEIRDQVSGNREQKTAIWRGGGRGAGLVKATAFAGTD